MYINLQLNYLYGRTPTAEPDVRPRQILPVKLPNMQRETGRIASSKGDRRARDRGAAMLRGSELVELAEPPPPAALPVARRLEACPHLAPAGLLSWHANATWPSGRVPFAGEDVMLPAGQRVLLARSVAATLGRITIPASSELILGEDADGVALDTTGIVVHGALRAGAEACPLQTRVVITLHGRRPSTRAAIDALPPSYKGIHVAHGGLLDLVRHVLAHHSLATWHTRTHMIVYQWAWLCLRLCDCACASLRLCICMRAYTCSCLCARIHTSARHALLSHLDTARSLRQAGRHGGVAPDCRQLGGWSADRPHDYGPEGRPRLASQRDCHAQRLRERLSHLR